jgi:hypothetical protein
MAEDLCFADWGRRVRLGEEYCTVNRQEFLEARPLMMKGEIRLDASFARSSDKYQRVTRIV